MAASYLQQISVIIGLIADDVVVGVVILKVLKAHIPAIDNIDGECTVCIKQFIRDANQELEKLKERWKISLEDIKKLTE